MRDTSFFVTLQKGRMPMILLLIGLAMLAIAPFLYFGAAHFGQAWKFLENALIIGVTALVVLHLLPESIQNVGISAIFWAFGGLFLPSLLERLWHRGADSIHFVALLFALVGLTLHGLMDGAAISLPDSTLAAFDEHHSTLGYAVILHRLPEALFLWGVLYPKKGARVAASFLAVLGLATVIGFIGAGEILRLIHQDVKILFSFQAVVAGSLLHIAFDRHEVHDHAHEHSHDHHHH